LLALAIFGFAAGSPAMAACKLTKVAELPVVMSGLTPLISAKVNGKEATFVLDSGAFFSMVTPASATKFGLTIGDAPNWLVTAGATGETDVKLATAKDFTFIGVSMHQVQFLVGAPAVGVNADGLLGENAFNHVDVEYDLANGVIRLFSAEGCSGIGLAYWQTGGNFSMVPIDPMTPSQDEIRAQATLNGNMIHVVFDTGAPMSMLAARAARDAGETSDRPGVVPAGQTSGLGGQVVDTWLAPFSSFEIGGEQIKRLQLRFGNFELDDVDMLIGADFFLSHRVYVARSQNKLYFTYNGGPVFDAGHPPVPRAAPAASVAAAQSDAQAGADQPTDAAGFDHRGEGFVGRKEYSLGIADFDSAIKLDSTNPQFFYDRAMASWATGQRDAALADFNQALSLNPDHFTSLRARAALRQERGDDQGARADLDKALSLKPEDIIALMARGKLRLKGNDVAGARDDFNMLLAQDPSARLDVASAYSDADLFDDAIGQYDKWLATQPRDATYADALNGRCWARALSGRELDKALADCDTAVRLNPDDGEFVDSRGLVHLRQGQLDAAISDYDAALKLDPKLSWSLYGRGLAELRKGMKAQGDADILAATAQEADLPDKMKSYGVVP
jgi:tetratricopeptide (TPR) repeat protein